VSGKNKRFDPVFAENRKARHDYAVLDTIECGIVLSGTEVKSIRLGAVSLAGSYAEVLGGALWLVGADISTYSFGNRFNHAPKARRKLLVHAREVAALRPKTEAKGMTLVPLKVYLKNGRIKVALGVCKGKAVHDKRATLKEKALKRDLERQV
jgi:SsrA-binding protein